MTTNTELNEIFKKQKEAFATNSSPSLKERIDRLQRLEAAMMKNRVAFQKSLKEDFGAHSQYITDLFETGGVLGYVGHGLFIRGISSGNCHYAQATSAV